MTAAFAAGMLILLPLSVRAQEVQPAVTAENHTEETMEQPEDIIFVGDSRFVQMKNAVGENPYRWIAKGSQGYDWFVEEAVAQIDAAVQSGTKILINFGVNDVANGAKSAITAMDWVAMALICFILPAVLTWAFGLLLRRIGWIREGDLTLS